MEYLTILKIFADKLDLGAAYSNVIAGSTRNLEYASTGFILDCGSRPQ
jgi:hypothetical protein